MIPLGSLDASSALEANHSGSCGAPLNFPCTVRIPIDGQRQAVPLASLPCFNATVGGMDE